MANNNYISLEIDGEKADVDPQGQIPTIDYALEDEQDFEEKQSAVVFDIELPATLVNDKIHNTLHNPSVVDNTADQSKDNFKSAKYIANGQEVIIGKYLQQSVTSLNGRPQKYKGKIYGLNGDWVIDLKEKTISDFLNPLTHIFNVPTIINSWNFDGRNENQDYVYAPARYKKRFGVAPDPTDDDPDPVPPDNDVVLNDMRISISVYWLLYRGFKSAGYRIVSQFMDTDYYRRGVLPWTWGGFDFIDDSRWQGLKFEAIQNTPEQPLSPVLSDIGKRMWFINGDYEGFPDLMATDNGGVRPGAYDNSGTFEYLASGTLPSLWKWQYPATGPLVMGTVVANFSVAIDFAYYAEFNSHVRATVQWYKNGTAIQQEDVIFDHTAPVFGSTGNNVDFVEIFYQTTINPGDWIGCRIYYLINEGSPVSNSTIGILVEGFHLNFIRLGENSTIDLKGNYPKFKNFKWLDLLRGEIDLFDLSIQTDPIKKEVYIEPTHAYEINGTTYPGYYNRKQIEWSQKVDISKETTLELFSDYERELDFSFIDDSNDGGLKKVQDRNQTTIGMAKYILPERYKTEQKEKTNRFYSPVMHENHELFKIITGIAPQLIAIIPENISNTSSDAAENVYNPKRAWYKGLTAGVGGWRFSSVDYTTLPYMFAVNYKPGGEIDPVLSYADQQIGGVIAKGLMKKFFLQRLAILRHGRRFYPVNIMLNTYDVSNFLHRESIVIDNMEFCLTAIKGFDPINPKSSECNMWLFIPMTQVDADNSYPSTAAIQSGSPSSSFDVKWWPHLLLTTDIN